MGIIRCEQGIHFYDNGKFDSCPYCGKTRKSDSKDSLQSQKTISIKTDIPKDVQEFILDDSKIHIFANDYDRTVGIYSPIRGNEYVTGWLVAVKGSEKGRDFRLHHGFNYIGRAPEWDIYLEDDELVTRGKHCSVVYDEKTNRFFAVPGSGTITYVNGEYLLDKQELTSGDILGIGNGEYEFIAYCREDHTWEAER